MFRDVTVTRGEMTEFDKVVWQAWLVEGKTLKSTATGVSRDGRVGRGRTRAFDRRWPCGKGEGGAWMLPRSLHKLRQRIVHAKAARRSSNTKYDTTSNNFNQEQEGTQIQNRRLRLLLSNILGHRRFLSNKKINPSQTRRHTFAR